MRKWSILAALLALFVAFPASAGYVPFIGEASGRTPLVRREVDPGQYEVRIADDRFEETGERTTVTTGLEKSVDLAPVAREGAIEVTATDEIGRAHV